MTVLTKLGVVNLGHTKLTRDQQQTLFSSIGEGTKLKDLNLSYINLAMWKSP